MFWESLVGGIEERWVFNLSLIRSSIHPFIHYSAMKCQLNFQWWEGVGGGEWEGEASWWRELRGEVSLSERVEPYLRDSVRWISMSSITAKTELVLFCLKPFSGFTFAAESESGPPVPTWLLRSYTVLAHAADRLSFWHFLKCALFFPAPGPRSRPSFRSPLDVTSTLKLGFRPRWVGASALMPRSLFSCPSQLSRACSGWQVFLPWTHQPLRVLRVGLDLSHLHSLRCASVSVGKWDQCGPKEMSLGA